MRTPSARGIVALNVEIGVAFDFRVGAHHVGPLGVLLTNVDHLVCLDVDRDLCYGGGKRWLGLNETRNV